MLVTLLYFGANVAYHLTLPVDQIAEDLDSGGRGGQTLLPAAAKPLVYGMLMVSLAGALNGNILVGPRVVFAVSRDHRFFSFFSRLHPRTGVPVLATVAMCGWAIVLILLADVGSETDDAAVAALDELLHFRRIDLLFLGGAGGVCAAAAAARRRAALSHLGISACCRSCSCCSMRCFWSICFAAVRANRAWACCSSLAGLYRSTCCWPNESAERCKPQRDRAKPYNACPGVIAARRPFEFPGRP